jgi:phosphoglycolate phosphatase-like HAD superfamily hydrolase
VGRGPHPLLVLFDIDGTLLLRASRQHGEALYAAIEQVYGVGVPSGRVEVAGRTDTAIARSILLLAGVADDRITERMDDFRAVCCEEFARRCPADLSPKVAPGVVELLRSLAARDDVRLALVTGNLEPVARIKLRAAGLGHRFPPGQGAFGSDSEDRAQLPGLARRRAGAQHRPWPRDRAVVIGDTPRDIACARADGVRCVGVATGPFTVGELRGADAVVEDAGGVLGVLLDLASG